MSVNGIGSIRSDSAGSSAGLGGLGSRMTVKSGIKPDLGSLGAIPAELPPNNSEQFDRQDLDKAVDKLNRTAEIFNKRFHFAVHEATKRIMVKVIDNETGETLTEIPPEKVLDMIARIQETVGLLVDHTI